MSTKPIKSYSYQVSLLGTGFLLLASAKSIDTSRCYLSGTLLHSFFSLKSQSWVWSEISLISPRRIPDSHKSECCDLLFSFSCVACLGS